MPSAVYNVAFVNFQRVNPGCTRQQCHEAGLEAERRRLGRRL
jgi:hypothetical protein